MVEAPEDVKREPEENEDILKEEEKIKEEGVLKLTEAESIEVDSNGSFEQKENEVKVETGDGEKSGSRGENGAQWLKWKIRIDLFDMIEINKIKIRYQIY